MRWLARFRRAEDGQALVEFALLMPILLLILVGIIEFGRAWSAHQVLTDAAREGARKAAIADPNITQDSIVATVKQALAAANLDTSGAVISTPGWNDATGLPATVTIDLPYEFTFFAAVTLKTAFTMRNE